MHKIFDSVRNLDLVFTWILGVTSPRPLLRVVHVIIIINSALSGVF